MQKLLLATFNLLFRWRMSCLNPSWRSVIVIQCKDNKEIHDISQILAALPAKHFYNVPAIAIKDGSDIREIKDLPEDLLNKIRDALWE
jgi:hypothetical protein